MPDTEGTSPLATSLEAVAAAVWDSQARWLKRRSPDGPGADPDPGPPELPPIHDGRTLAIGTVRSADETDETVEIVSTQNGDSGLVAKDFRWQPDTGLQGAPVKYFRISPKNMSIENVDRISPSQDITREPRHAEMNLVAYALSLHLGRNPQNSTANFRLERELDSLGASKDMCLECQLALAVLSPGFASVLARITSRILAGGQPVLVIRPVGAPCSKNWGPPWPGYYDQFPNSDYFRDPKKTDDKHPAGTLRPERKKGKYVIGFRDGGVVIGKHDEKNKQWVWDDDHKIVGIHD